MGSTRSLAKGRSRMLTEGLFVNHYEAVAVILSGIGLTNLLLQ